MQHLSKEEGKDMNTGVGIQKKASDKLLELVNEVAVLERKAKDNKECRCAELRCNMEAHFGKEGRTCDGLFDYHADLTDQIFTIIAHYIKLSKPSETSRNTQANTQAESEG